MPPDRSGSFQVAANGDVLLATGIWDNVVVATSAPISYNTTVPQLVDYDIPENYTPGEGFDVLLLYQTKSTLAATPLDALIFEGADLGTPNLYRHTDATLAALPMQPLPETLGADWETDNLDTTDATVYLLRWDTVDMAATGIFQMTISPGFVRGPVN